MRPAAENEPSSAATRNARAWFQSKRIERQSMHECITPMQSLRLPIRLRRHRVDAETASRGDSDAGSKRKDYGNESPCTEALHRRGVGEARAVHGRARAEPQLRGHRCLP